MKGRSYCNIVLVSLCAAVLGGAGAEESLGADVCKSNGDNTKRVCVRWSDPGDPILNVDFTVDYDCPGCEDAPAAVLLEGSLTWELWSEVIATGTPANIGTVTTTDADNYTVKLANGLTPGTADVGSINLVPAGDHYSSLASGSLISGSVNAVNYGIRVERDSLNNGGVLDITIQGDLSGTVKAWTVPVGATFKVGGTLSSCLITIGALGVGGDVGGTIDIERWEGGSGFYVWGAVAPTGLIRFGDIVSTAPPGEGFAELLFNDIPDLETGQTQFDFAGTLNLESGVRQNVVVYMHGELLSGAVIDLNHGEVTGLLKVFGGGGGSIINGGVVSGSGVCCGGVGLSGHPANSFSGTATFDSVSASGEIWTENGGRVSGTINIQSDVAGAIIIDSPFSGNIDVGSDLSGAITLGGDVKGDVHVGGGLTSLGSVSVAGQLGGRGRIMVDGSCDGAIGIGEETDSLSLIHCLGGLGLGGTIEVNTIAGVFDAYGVIHVGLGTIPDPPNDITFDGSIQIHDDGAGGGGDLLGAIAIVGCHATVDDLQICLDGGHGGENITIRQVGCTNQVDWSCPGIGP